MTTKTLLAACIGLFCFATTAFGQAIGTWFDLLSYANGVGVAVADSTVYTATQQAVFTYSLTDFSVQKLSKANGLNDISDRSNTLRTRIAYHPERALLLIAYTNGNIDLLVNGVVYNIPDIKNALITGEKRINNISFVGRLAYLSTSFGVVVIDLVNREIKDTYRISSGTQQLEVNGVAVLRDSIYAATAMGVYRASLAPGINLLNFANWSNDTAKGLPTGAGALDIVSQYNRLFTLANNQVWVSNGAEWLPFYSPVDFTITDLSARGPHLMALEEIPSGGSFPTDARICRLQANGQADFPIGNDILSIPLEVKEGPNGDIWVADFARGLIKFTPAGYAFIQPDGPATSSVFDMALFEGALWAVPGGLDQSFGYNFNRDGIFSRGVDQFWYTFNEFNTPPLANYLDIIVTDVNQNTGDAWFGSYWGGAIKFADGQFTFYDKNNSSLQSPTGDPDRTTVSGLTVDRDGNAWVANNFVVQPLSVITPSGDAQAFSFPAGINTATDIAIDEFNTKWVVIPKNNSYGLVAFSHGDDLLNPNDDEVRAISTGIGNGNLHTNEVTTVAVDNDGEVWIGTIEGITVIYTPGSVFTGNADASRILIEQEGTFNYLLESEVINTIAIDGANRKWIGTNNGAFLMSDDGTEQIAFFNEKNSPLLADGVLDIEVSPEDGTVFFATERGIIAYRGTATEGPNTPADCKIYPNPVRETYRGPITIDGVLNNASVKITDTEGQMIWETTALGGRVIWDGNNYNGQRAQTGVYLIFIANDDGSQSQVCKLLLVN